MIFPSARNIFQSYKLYIQVLWQSIESSNSQINFAQNLFPWQYKVTFSEVNND